LGGKDDPPRRRWLIKKGTFQKKDFGSRIYDGMTITLATVL
jgi:hypothetical protein